MIKEKVRKLTHCNLINLRVVGFIIVSVKCFLSKHKGSADGLGVSRVLGSGCQVFINVVHGQNHSADV